MRFNVGVDFGRAGSPGGLGYWQGRCDFLGKWPDTDKVLAWVDIPISSVSIYPSILAPLVDYGGAKFLFQACDNAGVKKDSLRVSESFVPQENYGYTIVYYIGRLYTEEMRGGLDLLMFMPMPVAAGPPLPIGLGIYWPWIGRLR